MVDDANMVLFYFLEIEQDFPRVRGKLIKTLLCDAYTLFTHATTNNWYQNVGAKKSPTTWVGLRC